MTQFVADEQDLATVGHPVSPMVAERSQVYGLCLSRTRGQQQQMVEVKTGETDHPLGIRGERVGVPVGKPNRSRTIHVAQVDGTGESSRLARLVEQQQFAVTGEIANCGKVHPGEVLLFGGTRSQGDNLHSPVITRHQYSPGTGNIEQVEDAGNARDQPFLATWRNSPQRASPPGRSSAEPNLITGRRPSQSLDAVKLLGEHLLVASQINHRNCAGIAHETYVIDESDGISAR